MGSQAAKNGQKAANAGIDALRQNKRDQAALHFRDALDSYEEIENDAERRTELGAFALLLDQTGFPDLSLIAARQAVDLSVKLGDKRRQAEDIVTCGNAQLHLGNTKEAVGLYREALDICLANGDLDNAASASTNIAIIVGNQGDMKEAVKLMYKSLDYLAKKEHPATEITTRLALTQALEMEGHPPEEIFDVARPIARFANNLRDDQWVNLRGPLEQSIQRYVAKHPQAKPAEIKRDMLSGLF